MKQPDILTKTDKLKWSTGSGTDVWEMFCASMKGDVKTLKRLMDKDSSLVRGSFDYRTPLYFAVRENQLAAASLLLSRGASPLAYFLSDSLLKIAQDRGFVEMAYLLEEAIAGPGNKIADGEVIAAAIRNRNIVQVMQMLDESPGLLHARDGRTNQPIHWAVMTRQPQIIDDLLKRGADINAQRFDGARPVQLTSGDYHFRAWRDVPKEAPTSAEILAHLRAKGVYVDICTACAIGDIARVKELLAEDASLANRVSDYVTYYLCSGAPIKNAAAMGHIDIVKLLLEYGADPNLPEEGIAPDGHALHSAVCNGHVEIVKLLLQHGAYPNVDVESSADTLLAAIRNNDQPMVDLLCSHGAASKLHLLAYYGDVKTAAAMLTANPALANDTEALENAAAEGNELFVRLLLQYQPALATRIATGVHCKGEDGPAKSRELVEFLFEQGMDANLTNWLGVTQLHHFAQRGDIENAAIFISHGADVNAIDEELCTTPLGWAAKYGRLAMVELLLQHGADANLPAVPAWSTPLAWALRRGHGEIAALLEKQ